MSQVMTLLDDQAGFEDTLSSDTVGSNLNHTARVLFPFFFFFLAE
jgi:hypothetical protein